MKATVCLLVDTDRLQIEVADELGLAPAARFRLRARPFT